MCLSNLTHEKNKGFPLVSFVMTSDEISLYTSVCVSSHVCVKASGTIPVCVSLSEELVTLDLLMVGIVEYNPTFFLERAPAGALRDPGALPPI